MPTPSKKSSLSSFTVTKTSWFSLSPGLKKKRTEVFFGPGGFSQPQKLIQKLEISEATQKYLST